MDFLLAHIMANKKIMTVKFYLLYNYMINIIFLILCGVIICDPRINVIIHLINNNINEIITMFMVSIISNCQTVILVWLTLLCITRIPIKSYTNIYIILILKQLMQLIFHNRLIKYIYLITKFLFIKK